MSLFPEPLEDDQSFQAILSGTPAMIRPLLQLFSEEARADGFVYRLEAIVHGEIGPGFAVRCPNAIGQFFLFELPGQRTLFRVPIGRGSVGSKWEDDEDGSKLAAVLQLSMTRLADLGFVSSRARFKCAAILESAVRQLGAADEPAAFAAIGNMCRTAVIALAKEVYKPEMLPAGREEPKGNDASARLEYAASYLWGGRSSRQLAGLKETIEGRWKLVSAALHREHASREEAELCIVETTALFDDFALLVP